MQRRDHWTCLFLLASKLWLLSNLMLAHYTGYITIQRYSFLHFRLLSHSQRYNMQAQGLKSYVVCLHGTFSGRCLSARNVHQFQGLVLLSRVPCQLAGLSCKLIVHSSVEFSQRCKSVQYHTKRNSRRLSRRLGSVWNMVHMILLAANLHGFHSWSQRSQVASPVHIKVISCPLTHDTKICFKVTAIRLNYPVDLALWWENTVSPGWSILNQLKCGTNAGCSSDWLLKCHKRHSFCI